MRKSFLNFISKGEKSTPAGKTAEALYGLHDELTRQTIIHSYVTSKLVGDNVTAYNTRMMYEKLPKTPDSSRLIADTNSFFESHEMPVPFTKFIKENKMINTSANLQTGGTGTTSKVGGGLGTGTGTGDAVATNLFTQSAKNRDGVLGRQLIRWMGEMDAASSQRIIGDRMIIINKTKLDSLQDTKLDAKQTLRVEEMINVYNEMALTVAPMAVTILDNPPPPQTAELNVPDGLKNAVPERDMDKKKPMKQWRLAREQSKLALQNLEALRRLSHMIQNVLLDQEIDIPKAFGDEESQKLLDTANFGNQSKSVIASMEAGTVSLPNTSRINSIVSKMPSDVLDKITTNADIKFVAMDDVKPQARVVGSGDDPQARSGAESGATGMNELGGTGEAGGVSIDRPPSAAYPFPTALTQSVQGIVGNVAGGNLVGGGPVSGTENLPGRDPAMVVFLWRRTKL